MIRDKQVYTVGKELRNQRNGGDGGRRKKDVGVNARWFVSPNRCVNQELLDCPESSMGTR